ncbi:FecR domain-containing protein [Herbaspirillum autotrophicum]|uniref:FecR domain-containing protein n=1 Tax=Herbaspirillum autotrophicum TaxID=180195 RepID=UPI00067D45A9|nr:FecR domain-containing protein [Herbaspirillum autotrophicum]
MKNTSATASPPLNAQVVDKAVEWLVHLWSGSADSASRAEWQRWRAADPEHERAWHHIEQVNQQLRGRMDGLSANTAIATLAAPPSRQRRKALKTLSLALTAGTAAWLTSETMLWQSWNSQLRTATGERRNVRLADGTRLDLNTNTAVNVRYDDSLRLVHLVHGELMITTAKDTATPARPFMAQTAAGRVRALGTRFMIRQDGGVSHVAVLEGAVELIPATAPGNVVRIDAGQAASFDAQRVLAPPQPLGSEAAWTEGVLVASNQRLGDFIAELGRYRPGYLSCDPASADLRVSGVFPLRSTDRILVSLAEVLPIRVSTFARYWTRIIALPPAA